MISQFSPEGNHSTLADLPFSFPKDVYPIGRLDTDSEGLLLLSNDKKVNTLLLDPLNLHSRTYWVQVDGEITDAALMQLTQGVEISLNGKKYKSQPAIAKMIPEPDLPPRIPPVRFRKNIPTSWISLTLTEGKNRQVRKMTAACGFPTLRLVRYSIEDILLDDLQPGDVQELSATDFFSLTRIKSKK